MSESTESNTDGPLMVCPEDWTGEFKMYGGSRSDDFNKVVIGQALGTLWQGNSHPASREQERQAVVAAMAGMAPRDEIEGMMVSQLVGLHNAAMDCLRRAMLEDQTPEGRRENLNMASKLLRNHAQSVDGFERRRGRGRQQIRVEHVYVNAEQAVIGVVNQAGDPRKEAAAAPHPGKLIEHQPEEPMLCAAVRREPVPMRLDQDETSIPGMVSQSGEVPNDQQGAADATNVIKYRPKRPMRGADPQREPMPATAGARQTPMPDARGCSGERRAIGE